MPRYPQPFNDIVHFFDRLEDRVRHKLVHYRILYAVIATVGLVLFWRGIWLFIDDLPFFSNPLISILFGLAILLITGVYVTMIGTEIIRATLEREGRTLREISRAVTREAAAKEEGPATANVPEQEPIALLLQEVKELKSRLDALLAALAKEHETKK
ncbi:hypothetical protein EPN90_04165 [Patescibacteria group bacterium]|nr:MAG: hypothetical protein EPN90_04165 [Patescibacteria group bacterium]